MKRSTPSAAASGPKRSKANPILQYIEVASIDGAENVIEVPSSTAEGSEFVHFVDQSLKDDTETTYSIAEHMDIRKPLTELQSLLEHRLEISLTGYKFFLQGVQELDITKNLVNQCVQGEGMVQINVDVIEKGDDKRINIVDVLKPAEEVMNLKNCELQAATSDSSSKESSEATSESQYISRWVLPPSETVIAPESEQVTRWIAASDFRQLQDQFGIPDDPSEWREEHVRLWVRWAISRFTLSQINHKHWHFDGKALMELTRDEFQRKVPKDVGDLFWTHIELLRKCKTVAVLQHPIVLQQAPNVIDPKPSKQNGNRVKLVNVKPSSDSSAADLQHPIGSQQPLDMVDTKPSKQNGNRVKPVSVKSSFDCTAGIIQNPLVPVNILDAKPSKQIAKSVKPLTMKTNFDCSTGNSGQIQLWQFLLELLTDKDHYNHIQWVGGDGEFKLLDPETVAQLWGQRKNKPTMNYEKLSRALRYYYDGEMIAKVHGQRFVYKFVCDLKSLLGYNASELSRLVAENVKDQQNDASQDILT